MNVLIVDDEKYIREGLKSMIQDYSPSCMVETARDGIDAIKHLGREHFDLVLIDINMPHLNGIQLIDCINELDYIPPLVIISGYNDFNYAVAAMRGGAADYLLKPIRRENVQALINRYSNSCRKGVSPAQSREFLLRDVKCALLDESVNSGTDNDLYRRVCSILSCDSFYLVYLRINSVFFRAFLDEKLKKSENGQLLYITDVAGGNFILSASLPKLLSEQSGSDYRAGFYRMLQSDSFRNAAKCAICAMKQAFLLGQSYVQYSSFQHCPDTVSPSEIMKLVYFLCKGRITELRQSVITQLSDLKMSTPEYFEKFIYMFLDKLHELYPDAVENCEAVERKIRDIYCFESLDAYLQELFGFLYILSNSISLSPNNISNRYDAALATAISYINEHYTEDIDLAVVANWSSMNYSVLSREFKRYTGKSFVNYLKEIRISRACDLLAHTNLKNCEIAKCVGFYSEKQFAKVFKSIISYTPSEYRRANQP